MTQPYDYGPLQTFEVTWVNGHVERVQGHQCTTPASDMLGAYMGVRVDRAPEFLRIHGSIDGRWLLILQARVEDIRTIRNVTADEVIPGGAS